jgi:hypothetical protein
MFVEDVDVDVVDNPLKCELIRSLEHYKSNQGFNINKGHIQLLPDKELELVNWLLEPRETRLQFQNLGTILNIRQVKYLRLLIFNILWSLPESPLSSQLHALYCPRIRQRDESY